MTATTYADGLAKLEFYSQWEALPPPKEAVDPFDYEQRMGVYKALIMGMNGRGVFGAQNEWNIFWGYVFQLDWQWRSGRLQFKDTPPGKIDANSMWGYANYTLSVLPYIAAAKLGIVPEVEILPPSGESAVEYPSGKAGAYKIPAIFDEAMRAWDVFFKAVLVFEPGKDIEPVRLVQWKAHGRSLVASEPGIRTLGTRFYSKDELNFLIGWVRMVDFLQAAAWRTDLIFMLENGVGLLPTRLITDKDVPGKVADMDERINKYLKNIIDLTRQSQFRFDFNLFLWRRAMRSRPARDEVVKMLDATFNPSPDNVQERRRLLGYVLAL